MQRLTRDLVLETSKAGGTIVCVDLAHEARAREMAERLGVEVKTAVDPRPSELFGRHAYMVCIDLVFMDTPKFIGLLRLSGEASEGTRHKRQEVIK